MKLSYKVGLLCSATMNEICSHTEKKEEEKEKHKVAIASEPAGVPNDAIKSTSVSLIPQLATTVTTSAPVHPVEVTSTNTLMPTSLAVAASTCSAVAPPPNVVISSTMSHIIPATASSSLGQQPSVVLPVAALIKPTSTQPKASSAVSSSSLTVPKVPSLVGTATPVLSFNNVKSTASSSSSQVTQPTLSFSVPAPITSSSSSLKIGAALGATSSLGKGLSLPSSSGTGLKLQLPTSSAPTALGTSSSLGNGFGLPSSLGGGFKFQLTTSTAASTTGTAQMQPNLLHNSKYWCPFYFVVLYCTLPVANTLVTNAGQTSTTTSRSSMNLTCSIKPSVMATSETLSSIRSFLLVCDMGSFLILSKCCWLVYLFSW